MKPILKRGQYVQAQSTLYTHDESKVAEAGEVGLVTNVKGHIFEGVTIGTLALVYFENAKGRSRQAWVNERALKTV